MRSSTGLHAPWILPVQLERGSRHAQTGHHTLNADPFAKKDWYDIKAPGTFTVRNAGKTLVSRTAGTKVRRMAFVCGAGQQ